MDADAPVGFLCSGGLDSSLVCAIAARMTTKPIKTFAVGIEDGPIDTKYARIVADYLGTDHTEVLFSKQQIFDALSTLIYRTETWEDRKSTRLNSSHVRSSYAVFCLKKKKRTNK